MGNFPRRRLSPGIVKRQGLGARGGARPMTAHERIAAAATSGVHGRPLRGCAEFVAIWKSSNVPKRLSLDGFWHLSGEARGGNEFVASK